MPEVKELLEDAIKKREKLVEEINELAIKRQEFLQEALRLDGEIRVLRTITDKQGKEL